MIRTTAAILISLATVAEAAPPRTPRAAAEAAVSSKPSPFVRYLWNYPPQQDAAAGASFAVNSVVSRVATPVRVVEVAEGILAVDLAACARDDEQLAELVALWASLANDEPYFHERVSKRETVKPYRATSGKTYDYVINHRHVPANHLGEAGVALEQAIGNADPLVSLAPILRLDHFVSRVTGTIDGGLYYAFRGLKVGTTRLDEYAKQRGVDLGNARTNRSILLSRVTGKPRAITFALSTGVRPSEGPGLLVITEDVFDRSNADPYQNLLDFKPDGFEVMWIQENGHIECTLWDGNRTLVAEAPPNLVSDHRVPEPFTRRLHGLVSCVRCHASEEMWQPADNEFAIALGQRLRVQGDRQFLVRLAELYSGDTDRVLAMARDSITRAVRGSAGSDVPTAGSALARLVNAHEHEWIDARRAVVELGRDVADGDETGAKTLQAIIAVDPHGTIPDDPVLGLLMSERLNVKTGKREGLRVNRRQWERSIGPALGRLIP